MSNLKLCIAIDGGLWYKMELIVDGLSQFRMILMG